MTAQLREGALCPICGGALSGDGTRRFTKRGALVMRSDPLELEWNGKLLPLSPLELNLMATLMARGRITLRELRSSLPHSPETMRVIVYRIRNKFHEIGAADPLQTVRSGGLKLLVEGDLDSSTLFSTGTDNNQAVHPPTDIPEASAVSASTIRMHARVSASRGVTRSIDARGGGAGSSPPLTLHRIATISDGGGVVADDHESQKLTDGLEAKRLREASGMSQADFGLALGISRATIWRIERSSEQLDRRTELAMRFVAERGSARLPDIQEIHDAVTQLLEQTAVRGRPPFDYRDRLQAAVTHWGVQRGAKKAQALLAKAQTLLGTLNVTTADQAHRARTLEQLDGLRTAWRDLHEDE